MIAKKNKNKKLGLPLLVSLLAGMFVITIAGFLAVSNWKISQRRNELNSRIEFLKNEVNDLEERNLQLQAEISQAQSPEYMEKILRENLNYKKVGEEVIVVKTASSNAVEQELVEEKNFWDRFLEKFGF